MGTGPGEHVGALGSQGVHNVRPQDEVPGSLQGHVDLVAEMVQVKWLSVAFDNDQDNEP